MPLGVWAGRALVQTLPWETSSAGIPLGRGIPAVGSRWVSSN
jgi:hypothetical protein